jgi:hypothetical protein
VTKILTQLSGKWFIIANAYGHPSVWGDSFTKAPFIVDGHGRGLAWARSLLEDKILLRPYSSLTPSILSLVGHQIPDITLQELISESEALEFAIGAITWS